MFIILAEVHECLSKRQKNEATEWRQMLFADEPCSKECRVEVLLVIMSMVH